MHVVEFVAIADPKYMKPPPPPPIVERSGARSGPRLLSNGTLASCFPCIRKIKIKIRIHLSPLGEKVAHVGREI